MIPYVVAAVVPLVQPSVVISATDGRLYEF